MIFREGGHAEPRKKTPLDSTTTGPENLTVAAADTPKLNRPEPPKPAVIDEAEQTAFFHRTLELMDLLDNIPERDGLIMNIQIWVTGGYTASAEWYQKIGERLRTEVFIEELPDLTEQQRTAITEFMTTAQLELVHRPEQAGPVRRHGWIGKMLGKK